MRRRVLDTNRLIAHWRRSRIRPLSEYTRDDAAEWARALIKLDATDAIVTPVVVEFLCGSMNPHELELARSFLNEFDLIDRGQITVEDWELAKRFAAWVRGDPKPRDFADCLIAAIARRLGYEPLTSDLDFQRRS